MSNEPRDIDEPEWEREWAARAQGIQKTIAREAGHDLNALIRAGAERQKILFLLVLHATNNSKWTRHLSAARDRLETMAEELSRFADRVQRTASDPMCNGHFWLAVLEGLPLDKIRNSVFPVLAISEMRRYAQYSRAKAELFQKWIQEKPVQRRREYLSFLLYYVHRATGSNHDERLARLLTDAHEAAGSKKVVTAIALLKHRQRYIPSLSSRRVAKTKAPKTRVESAIESLYCFPLDELDK